MNHELNHDPMLHECGYLPVSTTDDHLFRVIGDGVLLWCVGRAGWERCDFRASSVAERWLRGRHVAPASVTTVVG